VAHEQERRDPDVVDEQLSVAVDEWATDTEVSAVEDAFREAGISVEVSASIGTRSLEPPWAVWVELASHPLSWFLAGFFAAEGAAASKRLRDWITQVREARKSAPAKDGSIVIRDDRGNFLVFGEPSDEACDKLLAENWDDLKGGYLLWDSERHEWRDHTGNRASE
jgi:hypothetical protein